MSKNLACALGNRQLGGLEYCLADAKNPGKQRQTNGSRKVIRNDIIQNENKFVNILATFPFIIK
jgi:hypothetical protein